jgi:transcriptional regulator with XRE-family HTH domain
MTRAEFAEAMRVDISTVWKWENGKMLPDPSRMPQLSSILKTPLTAWFPIFLALQPSRPLAPPRTP